MTLWIVERARSEAVGPARANIRHWLEKWRLSTVRVKVRADELPGEFDCLLN